MANGDSMDVVGFQFRCGKLNILFFNQTAFWCLSQKEEKKHLELVSQKSFPNGDMQVFCVCTCTSFLTLPVYHEG